jgi:hypothetical protein
LLLLLLENDKSHTLAKKVNNNTHNNTHTNTHTLLLFHHDTNPSRGVQQHSSAAGAGAGAFDMPGWFGLYVSFECRQHATSGSTRQSILSEILGRGEWNGPSCDDDTPYT